MKIFKNDRFVFLILLIALLFRLPGIMDSLPAVNNSTEYFLAKIALNFGAQKSIDPGVYIYPTFYTYLLFLLFALYYVLSHFMGFIDNIYSFAVQFLVEPNIFYILARSLNVIISLISIYILYIFLKKYANEKVARIAAAIMACSSYLTQYSYQATPDTLLVFFSTLTTIYFYRVFESPSKVNFFLTGLYAGLAIAAKYNAGFLLAGLLVVIFQLWRIHKIKLIPTFILSLGGVSIGFFTTNPLWLVYPQRFYEGLRIVSAQMYSAVNTERGIPFIWETVHLIQDELFIGVIFICATIYFFRQEDKKHIAALSVILLTFFYVGTWTKKGIDYLLSIYPAWIILGGFFLYELVQKKNIKNNIRLIFLYIVFITATLKAIHTGVLLLNKDTREQTTDWITSNINQDEFVCYDNTHIDLGVFDINRYLIYGAGAKMLPEPIKQEIIGYKEDPRQVNFTPILVANPSCTLRTNNPYESEIVGFRRRTLSELIHKRTDYLICNSWFFKRYITADIRDYSPGIQIGIRETQNFYQQLFEYYKPIKVFKPDFWSPGPEIRIYSLHQLRQKRE
jgi:hypothetical protein